MHARRLGAPTPSGTGPISREHTARQFGIVLARPQLDLPLRQRRAGLHLPMQPPPAMAMAPHAAREQLAEARERSPPQTGASFAKLTIEVGLADDVLSVASPQPATWTPLASPYTPLSAERKWGEQERLRGRRELQKAIRQAAKANGRAGKPQFIGRSRSVPAVGLRVCDGEEEVEAAEEEAELSPAQLASIWATSAESASPTDVRGRYFVSTNVLPARRPPHSVRLPSSGGGAGRRGRLQARGSGARQSLRVSVHSENAAADPVMCATDVTTIATPRGEQDHAMRNAPPPALAASERMMLHLGLAPRSEAAIAHMQQQEASGAAPLSPAQVRVLREHQLRMAEAGALVREKTREERTLLALGVAINWSKTQEAQGGGARPAGENSEIPPRRPVSAFAAITPRRRVARASLDGWDPSSKPSTPQPGPQSHRWQPASSFIQPTESESDVRSRSRPTSADFHVRSAVVRRLGRPATSASHGVL